jgi:hypothetical protein
MANDRGSFDTLNTLKIFYPISAIGDYALVRDSGGYFVYTSTGWKEGCPSNLVNMIDNAIDSYGLEISSKNNLTASTSPTVTDDSSKGYSAGSVWIYNGITYTCTSALVGLAIWISTSDMFYFDSWDLLVAAISIPGTTYVGKYCEIANANGGPSSGITYTAPITIVSPIVDGGMAVYNILAQGTNYSVTCQKRTVTNPVITSIMTTATIKPTTSGYYIFAIAPTDLLPTGISLNDIAYYDGSNWSRFQSYSYAPSIVIIGTITSTQIIWRKRYGGWVSDNIFYGTLIKPIIDSTQALTITNTSGTNQITIIDTTNGNISLGGTKPNANVILDLYSTTKGFRTPLMTKAQRIALTAIEGLEVYQTDNGPGKYQYINSTWQQTTGLTHGLFGKSATQNSVALYGVISWDVNYGNMTLSSNTVSLLAGKTYSMTWMLHFGLSAGTGEGTFSICDNSSNVLSGQNALNLITVDYSSATAWYSPGQMLYTPANDISIKIVCEYLASGITTIYVPGSWWKIDQVS